MAAKSQVPATLTRKAGPAPVWVWAVVAIVGYYVYANFRGGSAGAAVSPSPNVQASGQTQGDAGAGNAAGGLTADLIAALAGNFGVHDAYNSYAYSTIDSHDYSATSSTSIDYGTGNTYDTGTGKDTGTGTGTKTHTPSDTIKSEAPKPISSGPASPYYIIPPVVSYTPAGVVPGTVGVFVGGMNPGVVPGGFFRANADLTG